MANRYERHRQNIIAKLAQSKNILDIGCSYIPNRLLRADEVVGLDLNPMDIQPPYTEHIVGDANDINSILQQRQFDIVILGEVIEHVEQPYDLLRKIHRHITPGGKLIMSTPNPLGLPVVFIEYLGLRKYFYTPNHLYYFTPRWVWRLLEKTGYKVSKSVGCGASIVGLPFPMPPTLSYNVIYIATPV